MAFKNRWSRRTFLGATGMIAGWASAPKRFLSAARAVTAADTAAPNVYEELGVITVINGQGTMTMLGGSLIPPEVEAAMDAASKHFVRINSASTASRRF